MTAHWNSRELGSRAEVRFGAAMASHTGRYHRGVTIPEDISYLEIEIHRLGDCLWKQGIKHLGTWPG